MVSSQNGKMACHCAKGNAESDLASLWLQASTKARHCCRHSMVGSGSSRWCSLHHDDACIVTMMPALVGARQLWPLKHDELLLSDPRKSTARKVWLGWPGLQGCKRPLTYDFMKNAAEALGRKVETCSLPWTLLRILSSSTTCNGNVDHHSEAGLHRLTSQRSWTAQQLVG